LIDHLIACQDESYLEKSEADHYTRSCSHSSAF
jgi:hypothetical protein